MALFSRLVSQPTLKKLDSWTTYTPGKTTRHPYARESYFVVVALNSNVCETRNRDTAHDVVASFFHNKTN
jgi:hypothetical protein